MTRRKRPADTWAGAAARAIGRVLNPRADLSRLRQTTARRSANEPGTGVGGQRLFGDAPDFLNAGQSQPRHLQLRHVVLNAPLLFGSVIVAALLVGVLFGPTLAPENPYLRGRRVLEYRDGTFYSPPFPPSSEHPLGTDELGRDTLSMLLHGTRNTLVAATFITMARLVLGLIVGGIAGWSSARVTDRIVMGTIQVLTSLPMLLVAMILILALDVRRGLPVFIAALCAVGWGEIAQFVRAEFIRIKQEPFLDSGRVIGLTPLELMVRHILPNVLPSLIVITLLEMGAVLMILGELGFIGIYIGGGISIQVDDFTSRLYFAVPEWGAMMAGARAWARSRPWMVMYPAVAFFVSVTGFNLLGEGLRRLIERGIFSTAVLLNWRVILAGALTSAATVYVVLTLGPAPSYRRLAQQIEADDLVRHVEVLSSPDMNGRGVGSPESYVAAQYIADQLESFGLSAPPGGYLQEASTTIAPLAGPPELTLVDNAGRALESFIRFADYSESVERHGGSGLAEAPVTLVVFPPDARSQRPSHETYATYKGLDLRGQVVLILSDNAPRDFDTEALIRGAEGVLIVSSDIKPRNQVLSTDYLESPTFPVFRISPSCADAIIASDGLSVRAIRTRIAELGETGSQGPEVRWSAHQLGARIRMRLQLEAPKETTLYNVVGLLNGADASLADQLVVVSCHYDGLGRGPDGTVYPGANGSASGAATMLEIARLWQEQGFQPRRSVLFAAWAGGELTRSGAHYFRDRPGVFVAHYDIAAVIHLDRLGGMTGDGLVVHQMGQRDTLMNLLRSSASELEVKVTEGTALRHHYQRVFSGEQGDQLGGMYGTLVVTWGDPERGLADDTLDAIDPLHLSQAAQVVNLTLITAAHEPRF